MYVVICDETLLCTVQLDWAIVVVLVPNSFDFLTGGGTQLVVDVHSPADVTVSHLYKALSPQTLRRRYVGWLAMPVPHPDADPHMVPPTET